MIVFLLVILVFPVTFMFFAIFHSKSDYDRMIDDEGQLEFLKEWRASHGKDRKEDNSDKKPEE